MKIESILKEIRIKKGLLQPQTAEMLGICLRTYQRIEKGQQTITLKVLARINQHFGREAVDRLLAQATNLS